MGEGVLEAANPQAEGPYGNPGLSLRATVQRGAAWSMAAYGASQALRFAGNLALTHLLVPEAFGLMAIVNAMIIGLQLFSDIGIGPSIIQSPRGSEQAFLDTAWTLQVARGFLLWLVACAVGVPLASFYGEPMLAQVMPIAGATALFSGFNSTRLFSMYRRVDLARISVLELVSQAVGLVVMIVWALLDRSIWSLVAGGLAGSLSKLVLSHTLLLGESNRFHVERSALSQMLRFGRWIFLSTILTFLVGQSDRLIFGKMVPIDVLGIYSVGAMLATMPMTALGRMASSVLFPVYSRVHNSGGGLEPVFDRVRRPLLLLGGWMIACLGGAGAAIVRSLYDVRYDQAGWIVMLLSFGSWFAVLESTNGSALLARGQSNWMAASSAGKLAGMLVLIPLGYRLGGFPGAVAGLGASEVFKYAVSAFATARSGLSAWGRDIQLTLWVLASAAIGWLVTRVAAREDVWPFAVAALGLCAVTLCWAPFGAYYLLRRRSARLRAA